MLSQMKYILLNNAKYSTIKIENFKMPKNRKMYDESKNKWIETGVNLR